MGSRTQEATYINRGLNSAGAKTPNLQGFVSQSQKWRQKICHHQVPELEETVTHGVNSPPFVGGGKSLGGGGGG